jgi:aspartate oxidase
MSGLLKWVEECISVEGFSFVDDIGWVATGINHNQVITKLKERAATCIEWASRRGLQFDTGKNRGGTLHM